MTTNELRKLFNDKYGMDQNWPTRYEVDHETYANVCQAIFDYQFNRQSEFESLGMDDDVEQIPGVHEITIFLGINRGIMFKNVELLLREG